MGSFHKLLNKAKERQTEEISSVIYEPALLCKGGASPLPSSALQPKKTDENFSRNNTAGILGWQDKENALTAITSTPLLGDVSSWTQWDDVFGPELGSLKDFLVNEGILSTGRKPSRLHRNTNDVVVLETQPGVLLRVTLQTSPECFQKCAEAENAVGCAGHLVSMVIQNGGVLDTPLALLANQVRSSLPVLSSKGTEGTSRCVNFVLRCLVRLPTRLCVALAAKVRSEIT